jgi:hypothetical protein
MMTKYDGRVKESTEAADRANGNRYRSVSLGDEKNSLHIYVHTNPASVAVMPSKDSKFWVGIVLFLLQKKMVL